MLTDLRLALRSLRTAPGFTAAALLVLALGIGATTAIFSVVDAVVLRGLPFADDSRLVSVQETDPTGRFAIGGYVAAPNFDQWRRQQRVFEDVAAYQSQSSFVLREGGEPERLVAYEVSASLFPLLRVTPRIGRAFSEANTAAGDGRHAVISDAFWRRRFGADPAIVGKTLRADNGTWEIVGVMAPGFTWPLGVARATDVWVPYAPPPDKMARGDGNSRDYNLLVVGRLKPGVSIAQARANMEQITGALKQAYPRWFRDRWVAVMPLQESIVGKSRAWMLLLLGAVACVLLIACVNVANLMLARATTRAREIGVRAALGASRWQLARGLIAESLVLAATGTALGVGLALWGVRALRASLPPTLPRLAEVAVDARVLAAAAAAAILTGLAVGLLPAIQLSRPDLTRALREGGRSGGAGARHRVRSVLLIAEVALAIVLLVGSGLFISSFVRLVRVDLGVGRSNILTVGVNALDFTKPLTDADYARGARQLLDVLDRVRQIHGVEAAAFSGSRAPLGTGYSRTVVKLPDGTQFTGADGPDVKTISADYFRTLGVPVLAGRAFTDADGANPGGIVILNDEAAKRFVPGRDPIGAELEVNGHRTVVGVVKAIRIGGPEAVLRPEVYLPFDPGRSTGSTIVIRTRGEPAAISRDVRAAIHAVLPALVIPKPQTLDEIYDSLIVQRRFNMIVLALFGALAIVIAGAGIYGVMAYIVEQRTAEIGVRMALGARPAQMLGLVLARATWLMAAGLAIGLGAAWMLARLVAAFLFQVEPRDAVVFAGASVTLLAAGLVAAALPARRAANVDPLVALRS